MSISSGIVVKDECIRVYEDINSSSKPIKFAIFKIADNQKEIEVEYIHDPAKDYSGTSIYEDFRTRLSETPNPNPQSDVDAKTLPRYGFYNIDYDLPPGEGKRNINVLFSWVPRDTERKLKMLYSTSLGALQRAFSNIGTTFQLDEPSEVEWKEVLKEATHNKAVKGF